MLGTSPLVAESERPAIGESSSQPPPGAQGPHANPVIDRAASRRIAEVQADVMPPNHHPTGAAKGPHPPSPPYDEERRVVQLDQGRWGGDNRREQPFTYPKWRT